MRTCHHLHGGMGVDVTYPMHRYFSWVTDIAHALGVAGRRRADRGPDDQEPRAHRRAARAQGRAARLLHRARGRQRAPRHGARPARRDLPAGGPPDGRRRLDGRRLAEGVRRPRARRDRADDLRQRGAARRRAPAGGHAADGRPDADPLRHREAEGPVPRSGSWRATCTSRSATASPTPAPTWPRCAPPPGATATTTSSTARRCGPPAATRPTTSGSPCAPTRTPPSTRASRS